MRRRTQIIIGVLGLLFLVLLAVSLFLRYQVRKSFPLTSGTIRIAGLLEPVEVARDDFGVPHIKAANEHDLMVAAGFVHAQDRLWQMDIMRRIGEGRLSELFGSVTVPFDRMFRIVGLRRISEVLAESVSVASRNRLQWYADGVNALITVQKGKLPVEFDLLGYEPEAWTPVHSLVVGRVLAWEMNMSWWSDLTVGAIAERVGLVKALDVFPSYPPDAPVAVPSREWRAYASAGMEYLHTAQAFREFFGRPAAAGGSNAWVVAGTRSSTGKVLLANDTHLFVHLPSLWYEMQIQCPGCNTRGMSVPGVPGIVAGRNDSIAWGITNLMADDADFYVEQVDSSDTTRYLYDGHWLPMTVLTEQIHVRADSSIPVTIRLTRRGPIISDIRTMLQRSAPPYVASMQWTGAGIDDQVEAFTRMNRARTWAEFTEGVRAFAIPGQNFVYGDVQGNIGYWCGVKLPIRGKQSSLLPLPGWDKNAGWTGFVPFEQLPHRYNPPEGYIASANNKVVDDTYPYHISDLWEPPSRIVRLQDVLGRASEMFSVQDFERLQNDTYSQYARDVLPVMLGALNDTTPGMQQVLEYFRNWNFLLTKEDIATTVFQQWYVKLVEDIYKDEMGDDLYHDFVILVNIPMRVTARLLQEGTSPWFDDVRTEGVERRDDIIRRSLGEALSGLRSRFGNEMRTWRWGELHTVTIRHPFGLVKPLDRIFSLGPSPFPGGSTALISGEYSLNDPFEVVVAPSFRQIFDLANPVDVRVILPSGQSGQVFHDHFRDQTSLWLNGGYRLARLDDSVGHWDRLRLEPMR